MINHPWASVLPSRWYAVRSAPASGVYNMAVDSALLSAAYSRPFGVMRVYDWAVPTISFGRNESTRTRFDAASVAEAGFDVVRRPTGGRALLHAAEVTYSFALPLADEVPWTLAYAALNATLLAALVSLGVNATLVTAATATAVRPEGPVCFDHPAAGEIVVGDAKLVGSAVWRERGAYLQHGSILLHDRQEELRRALIAGSDAAISAPTPAAASLATCLPHLPSWHSVATALEDALRASARPSSTGSRTFETTGVSSSSLDELLDADDLARHEERFRDSAWLWRR